MRSLFTAIVFVFSSLASADVFDPNSCPGTMISPQRALELLGAFESRNLADGEYNDAMIGEIRTRQQLQSVWGPWNPRTSDLILIPTLLNDAGRMSLRVWVTRRATNWIFECTRNLNDFTCKTAPSGEQPYFDQLTAVVTNSCVRITAKASDGVREDEWAFVAKF